MRRAALLLFTAALLSIMAPPTFLAAQSIDIIPSSSIDCSEGNNANSAVCSSKSGNGQNPISGNQGVLLRITDFVAYIAGIAAVIMVVVGGIRFITADGDSGNVKSARNTVLYAMVGIIVIVSAKALINFVILRI